MNIDERIKFLAKQVFSRKDKYSQFQRKILIAAITMIVNDAILELRDAILEDSSKSA